MSTRCGKRKLRGLYQILKPPTRVARQTTRNSELRMSSPQLGTNGKSELIPLLGDFSRRFVTDMRSFRRSDASLALYVASLAIGAAGISLALLFAGFDLPTPWGVIALADVAFAATINKLRRNGGWGEAVRTLIPIGVGFVVLYAPLIAILAIAYRELTPWTLALFFAPALAAQRLFVLYQEQRRLTDDLVAVNEQLERAGLSFASALVATLDARDRYTAGHSAAVAVYARDIAGRMGLSAADQQLAHLCGLVHDIGKVGLPPGLLEKPGPLSLHERRVMEEHPVIGQGILEKVENYGAIATIVRHHHERIDGNGYPDGLIGNEIPVLSRIIAVA